jgi:hypothetical protein
LGSSDIVRSDPLDPGRPAGQLGKRAVLGSFRVEAGRAS